MPMTTSETFPAFKYMFYESTSSLEAAWLSWSPCICGRRADLRAMVPHMHPTRPLAIRLSSTQRDHELLSIRCAVPWADIPAVL